MISFRLTSEEYRCFRELCGSSGSNISELARMAVNALMNHQPPGAPQVTLANQIGTLLDRVNTLQAEFREFYERERVRAGETDR